MRRLITRKGLEVASWIATLIGVPLALYQFYVMVFDAPAAKSGSVDAKSSSSQQTKDSRIPLGDKPNVLQKQSEGTQIGYAHTVNINKGSGEKSDTLSSSQPAQGKLAAFNVNSNGGYWAGRPNDDGDAESKIRYIYRGTEYWSELANCLELSHSKSEKKKCGNGSKLLPSFDVTLIVGGQGQIVLNEIRAQIIYMSEYKGSAGELPSAAIPKSAKYTIRLPPIDAKQTTVRIGTIPPLLIESDRPARFELLFIPDYTSECVYDLRLEFVLSSGQIISTLPFRLDFSQGPVPGPEESRIPAAAKQYWSRW